MNHSTHLSSGEQDELRRLYQAELKTGGDKITHEGLYNLLCLAGISTTRNEVNRIYSKIDSDSNGVIDES